jgi:putative FmdB family regulatory protein
MPRLRYNFRLFFMGFVRSSARPRPTNDDMPIYEYRCASCGHELEALQKLSDAPLTLCPACHHETLRKQVSAAGFQLKGSGWYVTDFRNSGAKPAKKSDDKAAPSNGAGDAKPSEAAKTDTTTETTSTKSAGSTETKSTTTASSDKSGT